MLVNELAKQLNDKISYLIGTKVNVADIHNEIEELINPMLEQYELGYFLWAVEEKEQRSRKLFKLELNIEDDKRYAHKRKGKILDLKFVCADDRFSKIDLSELKKTFRIIELTSAIANNEKHVEKLKLELKEAEQRGIDAQNELMLLL